MSETKTDVQEYALVDAFTGKTVRTFTSPKATGQSGSMSSTYRLDFSNFQEPGTYYLKAGKAVSPRFPINAQVYNGTADFLLNYMRQQRCGYNPFLKDSCHVHDGYIVYHPTKTGQHIDVRGGWHDATDYLQYTTTSANAIYQMMFAYQETRGIRRCLQCSRTAGSKRHSRYSRRNKMGAGLAEPHESRSGRTVQPDCRRPRPRRHAPAQ